MMTLRQLSRLLRYRSRAQLDYLLANGDTVDSLLAQDRALEAERARDVRGTDREGSAQLDAPGDPA